MGDAVGGSGEPLSGGDERLIDDDAGKALDEGEEQAIEIFRAKLSGEVAQCVGVEGGIDLAAVVRDESVAQLVDDAHGEE